MNRIPTPSWYAPLTFCAGLLVLAGCGVERSDSGVVRSDSAGIEIVVNGGTDRPLDREFRRLFAIGGADQGPEAFYRVTASLVGADAAGNIYVLDTPNARVAIFDRDGGFLRTLGAAGGGPGEFQTPGSISVDADGSVAVFDFGKGSLVRFDANGDVNDEQPFSLFPTPSDQRHFARSGNTIFVSNSTSPMDPEPLIQRLRRIVDGDTTVMAELQLPPVELSMYEQCGLGLPLPRIFSPELPWSVQPGRVAASASVGYSISLWEEGSLVRIVRRDLVPRAATRELALAHLGEGFDIRTSRGPCHIEPAEMVDKRGFADTVPLVRTLLLGPSGELWVHRFMVDPDAIEPIDVLDADGAYMGTIARESFEPMVLLPGDRVGVVETDELDVQRLVVYGY